jgi:hypothetical protein
VRVTDLASGRNKVNINIPMSLVNVGLKMGARFAPDIEGINFDEIVAAIKSGSQGKIVDVPDMICKDVKPAWADAGAWPSRRARGSTGSPVIL